MSPISGIANLLSFQVLGDSFNYTPQLRHPIRIQILTGSPNYHYDQYNHFPINHLTPIFLGNQNPDYGGTPHATGRLMAEKEGQCRFPLVARKTLLPLLGGMRLARLRQGHE